MNLRTPPSSIEAEQAVLGGLMLDDRSFVKVSDWLKEDDFYRRDHQLIYRAIRSLLVASKPADPVTLADWFDSEGMAEDVGGVRYVIDLADKTPGAANIVAYAEIVVEKSRLRRAIDIGTQLANAAFDGKRPADDVLGMAHHALTELQGAPKVGGLQPIKPGLRRMFAAMEERYEAGPGLLGIPTPWKGINDLTKGLRPGVLYVIAGRPSMGKSIAACQLAGFSAARGTRTAFFSAEMGEIECLQRISASIAQIPHSWVESPAKIENDRDGEEDRMWGKLTDAIGVLSEAALLIDETPAINIDQLSARARREHMRSPLGLIVTDHLHDMSFDRAREMRVEIGRVVQGHKTLAKELNIPVVLLAQLNRNVAGRADKRPVLTDLRESGEIEQKADVILFLHREDYYDKDTHMRGAVEVIPAKGRNLRLGDNILLRNRFDLMRMDDWEGPYPRKPEVQQVEQKESKWIAGRRREAANG